MDGSGREVGEHRSKLPRRGHSTDESQILLSIVQLGPDIRREVRTPGDAVQAAGCRRPCEILSPSKGITKVTRVTKSGVDVWHPQRLLSRQHLARATLMFCESRLADITVEARSVPGTADAARGVCAGATRLRLHARAQPRHAGANDGIGVGATGAGWGRRSGEGATGAGRGRGGPQR